jgi:tetratricopeptide (TPR) repeat protein
MEISAEISDILAQSRIQTSLGVTHFNLGAYKTSLSFFNMSMQVALNTGNKKALAILNGNTARIHAILNNMDAAFLALKEDMAVLNETGDLYGIAHASAYLGDLYLMSGDNPAACENYLKSFEISKKSQFLRPLILSACGLINGTPAHLLSQQAQSIVNELILIDSREIDIVSKSMILRARCAYETASGTYHRATCFINQALINFEKMNMPLETGLCLIDEANIMLLNGLSDMAEAKKKYAVEIFNKIGAKYYADKYGRLNQLNSID